MELVSRDYPDLIKDPSSYRGSWISCNELGRDTQTPPHDDTCTIDLSPQVASTAGRRTGELARDGDGAIEDPTLPKLSLLAYIV